jgi:arsenate reductase (thioredoxin)
MSIPNVAFVCTHNSCRSQIAEAFGKSLAGGIFGSMSAGTEPEEHINPDAERLMKQRYGIDMELTQRPKLLQELPRADIVITMGCGVRCPVLPCRYREDWGLDDPAGRPDEDFIRVIDTIRKNVLELKRRIQDGEIRI